MINIFKNSVLNISVDTKKWVKAAAVRAAKTMAQTAVALIPVAVSISQVDWKMIAGTSLLSGIISILTSISGIPEVKNESEDK